MPIALLQGPQPVFTLDEYLLVARTLREAMSLNPQVSEPQHSDDPAVCLHRSTLPPGACQHSNRTLAHRHSYHHLLQVADILYSFKRDFGWNWLGNLVRASRVPRRHQKVDLGRECYFSTVSPCCHMSCCNALIMRRSALGALPSLQTPLRSGAWLYTCSR